MAKLKQLILAAFIFGLLLAPAVAADAAGTAVDPLASRSWVEQYIEQQVAPVEASLAQLKQEVYAYLGLQPVNIVLTIGSPQVVVNGESRTIDAAPKIVGAGYTMLPASFVAQSLGIEVEWLAETRQVKFYSAAKTMLLTIGSTTALIDGSEYQLATAPVIDNSLSVGRTLVHARFVAEAFGCALDWEPKSGNTQTVYITR